MLRRIIRRAVRHAYLLGARDVVLPGMVDAVVATMGNAYPEIAASHEVVRNDRRARGGGVPRHVAARRRHARPTIVDDSDVSRRRRVLPARHARLPDRSHPRDRGGARPRGRPRRLRGADAGTAGAGPRRRPRRGRRAGRAARAVPRARRRARPDRVHRPPGVRVDGEGAGAPRRRRARRSGRRGHRGRRRARPHAVLRGVGRPGRRHRHDHDRARRDRRHRRHAVRLARPGHDAPRHGARRRRRRGRRGASRDRRRAPRSHPPQPHRHARACTGRCARCSARTCSRRVRSSGPTGCASTSRTTSR